MIRKYSIKDFLNAMYEGTEIVIIDDNKNTELFRGRKKDLPKQFYEKVVISDLGVMQENRWYFTIKN